MSPGLSAIPIRLVRRGAVCLMAVNGYYSLVSMVLNVDRTPIPNGGPNPLPVLK